MFACRVQESLRPFQSSLDFWSAGAPAARGKAVLHCCTFLSKFRCLSHLLLLIFLRLLSFFLAVEGEK